MQVRITKRLIKPLKDFAKSKERLMMKKVSVAQAANIAIDERLTPNPDYLPGGKYVEKSK